MTIKTLAYHYCALNELKLFAVFHNSLTQHILGDCSVPGIVTEQSNENSYLNNWKFHKV